VESYSRRRAAVRKIEEYLDVYERELPSIADLCAIAGVSERTLVYAFREQVGMPPGRFLRLRRLNGARKELRAAEPRMERVTDVAMRWGFWQLGRFAGEYLRLFGELPSKTLARAGPSRADEAPRLEAARC
jgi:AraC family ethanolamine operon transcriptional activator